MKKTAIKQILAFIIVLLMIVPVLPALPVSAAITSPPNGMTFTIGDTVTLNQTALTGGTAANRRYRYNIAGPGGFDTTIASTNNTSQLSWNTTGRAAGR